LFRNRIDVRRLQTLIQQAAVKLEVIHKSRPATQNEIVGNSKYSGTGKHGAECRFAEKRAAEFS
jgi:hypothetical protein